MASSEVTTPGQDPSYTHSTFTHELEIDTRKLQSPCSFRNSLTLVLGVANGFRKFYNAEFTL